MVHYNFEIPDSVHVTATPTEAVVGRVRASSDVDDVVAKLSERGIDAERVHVLQGDDGITFLQEAGTWLGRFFSDHDLRDSAMELLAGGATLMGVFGVKDEDQDAAVDAAEAAGIEVLARFGKWTYTSRKIN